MFCVQKTKLYLEYNCIHLIINSYISYIFISVRYCVILIYIIGWMSSKLGGKHLFGGGIMAAAVLTILTPPVARLSVYFLIVIRVIEGFFEVIEIFLMSTGSPSSSPPLYHLSRTYMYI